MVSSFLIQVFEEYKQVSLQHLSLCVILIITLILLFKLGNWPYWCRKYLWFVLQYILKLCLFLDYYFQLFIFQISQSITILSRCLLSFRTHKLRDSFLFFFLLFLYLFYCYFLKHINIHKLYILENKKCKKKILITKNIL